MWLDAGQTSIAANKVVAVEAINDLSCMVYTDQKGFKVDMPKGVVMSMIDSRLKGQSSMSNVEKLLTQMYQGQVTARP